MEYFDLNGMSKYRVKPYTTYSSIDPAAIWYKDTQQKLEYLVSLLKNNLGQDLKINYRERPLAQFGRGKIVFKNYVLIGFTPENIYPNGELFIKLAFHELKDQPIFDIEIDDNDKLSLRPFKASISEIKEKSKKRIKVDEDFPKDWDSLLKSIQGHVRTIISEYRIIVNPIASKPENSDISQSLVNSQHFPMNTILYGPPGTGKTFHSITHAVSIIQGVSFQSLEEKSATELGRKQIKDDFDKFVQNGQIVFTTFHQSMGYEDFIEGIKPLPPGKDGKIKYDIVDGIFKKLCTDAEENWLSSKDNRVGLNSFEDVFENLKDEWEHDKSMKFSMVTPGKEFTLTGFTNKSIPFKKASGGESHSLSINTLRDLYYGKRESTTSGLGIYYPGVVKKLKSFKLPEKGVTPLRKYVIVIDEINRGNVSQIFGEMITLIEKDKRLGEKEALSTVLPYSRDEFGVPPNVYIIGTMNTADRSVEALDTALRRRFAFVHMEPQENILTTDFDGKGIDLNALLKTLNNRLRILKDNDHTIGHAWLWNVKDVDGLKKVFADKILPLLQEYFYNDYEKMGLVLGDAFFELPHQKVAGSEFATFTGSSGLSGQYRNKYLYQLKDANYLELDDFLTLTPAIALHEN